MTLAVSLNRCSRHTMPIIHQKRNVQLYAKPCWLLRVFSFVQSYASSSDVNRVAICSFCRLPPVTSSCTTLVLFLLNTSEQATYVSPFYCLRSWSESFLPHRRVLVPTQNCAVYTSSQSDLFQLCLSTCFAFYGLGHH